MTEGDLKKSTLYCSFCGKSQHEVRKLIAGPTVFICDECIELCNEIIDEEFGPVGEKAQIAELVSNGRKMLDIPVQYEVFSYMATKLADYGGQKHWQVTARDLLLKGICIFAQYIVRERKDLDRKILDFTEKRKRVS